MSGISTIHWIIHSRCIFASLASGSCSSSWATFTARVRSSGVEFPRVWARPDCGARNPANRIAIAMARIACAFMDAPCGNQLRGGFRLSQKRILHEFADDANYCRGGAGILPAVLVSENRKTTEGRRRYRNHRIDTLEFRKVESLPKFRLAG